MGAKAPPRSVQLVHLVLFITSTLCQDVTCLCHIAAVSLCVGTSAGTNQITQMEKVLDDAGNPATTAAAAPAAVPPPTPQQAQAIEHANNIAQFVPWLLDPRTLPAQVARLEIKRLQSGWLRLFCALAQPIPVETLADVREQCAANCCTLNAFVKGGRCQSFQLCDDLEP